MKGIKKIILITGLALCVAAAHCFAENEPDGDFESMDGWTESEERAQIINEGYEGSCVKIPVGGKTYTLSGDIAVKEGCYTLTAYAKNSSRDGLAYISAKTDGRTAASTVIPPRSDGYRKITVPNIKADKDGKCHISISAGGKGGELYLDSLTLAPSEERAEFLTGGDISELEYVENNGGVFRRNDGTPADPLQIMAENGMNLARIRLFNKTGADTAVNEWYLPKGYQEESGILRLAKRADEKGMKLLLTFNYSDFWTDAEKQVIPSEWQEQIKDLPDSEAMDKLCELVYNFTYDFMTKMKEQGTEPAYVSVGNEVQCGILYPYGQLYADPNNPRWENFARLVNAGYDAVKAVSPECRTIIHLNMSGEYGTYSQYEYFFEKCAEYGVKYDIIGSSYYPYWTNENIEDKSKIMDNEYIVKFYDYIINKFDKDVIIMETGYNFSEKRANGGGGQLKHCGPYDDIYGQTKEGQKAFMADLFAAIKASETGRIIADIYWDPLMIETNGKTGWAIYTGGITGDNVVSNTTLFDFDGKMLPVFDVYNKTRGCSDKINIFGISADGGFIKVNGEKTEIRTDKNGGYSVRIPYTDSVKITDADGRDIFLSDKPEDNIYNADVHKNNSYIIKNNDKCRIEGTESGILIIAKYKDGALDGVDIREIDGGSREYDIPDAEYGSEIKLMFWENKENIRPVCRAYSHRQR